MQWSKEWSVSTAFLAALLALAAFRLYSHYNTVALIQSGRLVAHARTVEAEIQALLSAVQEARVASRDFLLTGDDTRLLAFAEARSSAGERTARLRELFKDDAPQAARFEEVSRAVAERLDALDRRGRLRKEQGVDAVVRALRGDVADSAMDRIRAAAAAIQAEEDGLLTGHMAAARASARREFWISAATTAVVAGLLVFAYWLLLRHLAHRRRARAEIDRLNEGLRHKVAELQTLFDVTPVGLVVAEDPRCRAIRGNRVMSRMLGVPAGGNLSKSAPEGERPSYRILLGGGELSPEQLPMQVAAATGASFENLEVDVAWDDRKLRLSANVVPLLDEGGRPRGAVGAFWDVSEFRSTQERLIDERDAAEAAAAAKERLLATVSHDLRTPLAATALWANRLTRDGVGDGERKSMAGQIVQMCEAQSQLVQDVLDITRISHGRLAVDRRPVDLAEVVRVSCDAARPAAEAKGIALEVDLPGPDGVVLGDAARLRQVFWNLLSNAVKFTPAGGRVGVTLRREDSQLRVRVADTGPGIRPDLLPHVFEWFWQAAGPGASAGHGLGLAIVKSLLDLHGGAVQAESDGEGRGAAFTVSLTAHDTAPTAHDTAPGHHYGDGEAAVAGGAGQSSR